MSEAIAGILAAPPAEVSPAAVVVLIRQGHQGREVFWVRRSKSVGFAPGFHAFPGGRVDARDELLAGAGDAFEGCAARELFEETGVALTGQTLAAQPQGSFAEWLAAHGQKIDRARLLPAGRWLTPTYLPQRFDTQFFLVELRDGESPQADGHEASMGEWIRPADALGRWEKGVALLHPPQFQVLLELLVTPSASVEEIAKRLSAKVSEPGARIQFQSGIWLIPLPTATLPPATHTNCYVLGTGRHRVLVDPGTDDARALDWLSELLASEEVLIEAIVATHHHGDHVGGVQALVERWKCPVWAHRDTASRLSVPVARLLTEGDVLELEGEMRWRVLHTPGHARGHLTLIDEASRAAICGDMVAGVGTIVIDPPEGDMGEYLRQLTRLKAHVGALYPSHGPVIADGVAKLDEYLAHRAWREGQVWDSLQQSPISLEELVPKAYDDVAAFVWPLAERNTAAILDKLLREGRVRHSAFGWSRV